MNNNLLKYVNKFFTAFEKALFEMKPEEIVAEISESNLRGRGGGGFSTGMKWMFTANAEGPNGKYVAIGTADRMGSAYLLSY